MLVHPQFNENSVKLEACQLQSYSQRTSLAAHVVKDTLLFLSLRYL